MLKMVSDSINMNLRLLPALLENGELPSLNKQCYSYETYPEILRWIHTFNLRIRFMGERNRLVPNISCIWVSEWVWPYIFKCDKFAEQINMIHDNLKVGTDCSSFIWYLTSLHSFFHKLFLFGRKLLHEFLLSIFRPSSPLSPFSLLPLFPLRLSFLWLSRPQTFPGLYHTFSAT